MPNVCVIDITDPARFTEWAEKLDSPSHRFALRISRFPQLRKGAGAILRCETTGRCVGAMVVEERDDKGVLFALLERSDFVGKLNELVKDIPPEVAQ